MSRKGDITVAIYPNYRGMGYVICRTPKDVIDYGIGYLKLLAPNYYVKRLCKFIEIYKPNVIVLKDYGEGLYKVKPRVKKVIETIELEAYKEKALLKGVQLKGHYGYNDEESDHLHLTALANSALEAKKAAYETIENLDLAGKYYLKDIYIEN